ncbi:MAG: hypothetical protein ABI405_12710 [Parafilimonas sp.]
MKTYRLNNLFSVEKNGNLVSDYLNLHPETSNQQLFKISTSYKQTFIPQPASSI